MRRFPSRRRRAMQRRPPKRTRPPPPRRKTMRISARPRTRPSRTTRRTKAFPWTARNKKICRRRRSEGAPQGALSICASPRLFLRPLDEEQLAARCFLPQLDERRVFGRAVPFERLLERRELEQHRALGRPAAFERLHPAAARREPAAVLLDGRRNLLAVLLVHRGV